MKFSVEIDDEVLRACDEERETLGAIVRSRNAYINLVLALHHGIGVAPLAKVLKQVANGQQFIGRSLVQRGTRPQRRAGG